MNDKEPNYPIKVLNKAFAVLDILLKNNAPMSMTEISEELHFYPSTIHRLLDTLKYGGYVEQDSSTQKYQLGLKLIELGMARLNQIDLIKEAKPFLQELSKRCDETIHLAILEDTEVLYLAKEESTQTIRMISYIGKRAPLHCTSLGKVLLAFLPSYKRDKILEKIELFKLTENTITNKQSLIEELNKIKQQGFALDIEENEKFVRCIAAPIRNYQGKVIAAASISGPSYRINEERQDYLKEELITTCQNISSRLGLNSI
jgi:DNA-binding IclR family transcriptional regulator